MREEERPCGSVIELTTIITLNGTNERVELSLCVGAEVAESEEDVGLEPKGKGPKIVSKVVENNEVVFVTGDTGDGRCPQITMN